MSPKLTHEEYLHLIYKVFTTTNGKQLLDVWNDSFLLNRKIAMSGDDLLSIGIKQGEATFIMSINGLIEQQNEINKKG